MRDTRDSSYNERRLNFITIALGHELKMSTHKPMHEVTAVSKLL